MKLLISAGELSGDMHAARLVRAIKAIDPSIEFYGMGGPQMEAAGVRIIADLTACSTVGLIEPIRYLPEFIDAFRHILKETQLVKPDLFIPVDFQGFNNLLLRTLQHRGIPSIYYIGPQEWQWGTDKGGRSIVSSTVKILAIFKDEYEFFKRIGGRPIFIGHPLQDIAVSTLSREELCRRYGLDQNQRYITVFPGSRNQEIAHTMPVLIETAVQLQREYDDIQVAVSVIDNRFEKPIRKAMARHGLEAILVNDRSYDLIKHSSLSLVTSGTITLEHGILGTPHICAYRFSDLSYLIAKLFFGRRFRKIPYFSLPNMLLRRRVIPEFLQDYANVSAMTKAAKQILDSAEKDRQIRTELD
ncbi:lipid-A-disaccharide synthase, partial [bacterium]|nr:lipid-A-disaccharide synthase [bacterium]